MRPGSIGLAIARLTSLAALSIILLAAPASAAARSGSHASKATATRSPVAPARRPGRAKGAAPAASPVRSAPITTSGHGSSSTTEKLVLGGTLVIAAGLLLRELTDF